MIKVVTDSMSYLPAPLCAERDIHVVPLKLIFGQETYKEGVEIDTEAFFERLSRERGFPTTSQPAPEDFVSAWQPLLAAGHEVLTVCVSSGLSGTVHSAETAARSLPEDAPVSVVDSSSMAMGLGMMVLRAAEMAREGRSREAIVSALQSMGKAVQIVFTLDTLEYLHRGGRINTVRAFLGTLLRVKPLIALIEGELEPLEQVRTTGRAHARLFDVTCEHLGEDSKPWISVMHSRSAEAADRLLRQLAQRFPGARLFSSEIGPVLGAHLGPGGVGAIACPSTAL